MSSPLRIFRKYQKQLIVIFGIMLMVSFLIAGSISSFISASSSRSSDYLSRVAVNWQYGEVTNGQLERMKINHARSVEFVRELVNQASKNEARPKDALIVSAADRATLEGITVDEAIMRTMALAKRAEQFGMIVDREAVESYFDRLTDNEIPRSQYPLILNQLSQGRMTYPQLINHVQQEMLAQQMRALARSGFATNAEEMALYSSFPFFSPAIAQRFYMPILSPAAAYDYHQRVFKKVRVELLPLEVEEYLDKVTGSPSEQELAAIFEEGKDRFADPRSTEPGFRQRRQIAFEYFEADVQSIIEQEMKQVSREEVRDYYEANKEQYRIEESTEESDDVDAGVDDEPGDEDAQGGSSEPEYRSLDDVENEIRRELAGPAATAKAQRALKNATAVLKEYFFEFLAWEQESEGEKPTPPDMGALAEKFGLEFERTPLQDVTQLDNSSLGQALRSEYDHERKAYVTVRIGEGDDPTQYLYWKTEETDERVPELEEVRDEVERAWRLREAKKLARSDAQQKAEQARERGESLREALGDDVIQTNEFSWLSPGGGNVAMGGGGLTPSFVFGVDLPGREFFETVTSLHEGEVAITHNAPETVYYVARVASEKLENDFFESFQPTEEVNEIGRGEQQRLFLSWVEQLERQMGIQWNPNRNDRT